MHCYFRRSRGLPTLRRRRSLEYLPAEFLAQLKTRGGAWIKTWSSSRLTLSQSVREMKAGRAARVTTVRVSPVMAVRNAAGSSAGAVCGRTGGVAANLQAWKQARRQPTRAAKTLLRVADAAPEVLRELAAA